MKTYKSMLYDLHPRRIHIFRSVFIFYSHLGILKYSSFLSRNAGPTDILFHIFRLDLSAILQLDIFGCNCIPGQSSGIRCWSNLFCIPRHRQSSSAECSIALWHIQQNDENSPYHHPQFFPILPVLPLVFVFINPIIFATPYVQKNLHLKVQLPIWFSIYFPVQRLLRLFASSGFPILCVALRPSSFALLIFLWQVVFIPFSVVLLASLAQQAFP